MPRRKRFAPLLSKADFSKVISATPTEIQLDEPDKQPVDVCQIDTDGSGVATSVSSACTDLAPMDSGGLGVDLLREALKAHGPDVPKLVRHFSALLEAERWIGGRSPIRTEDNPTRSDAGKVMLELYRSAGLLPPLRTAQAQSAPKVSVSFQLPGGTMKVEVGGDPAD